MSSEMFWKVWCYVGVIYNGVYFLLNLIIICLICSNKEIKELPKKDREEKLTNIGKNFSKSILFFIIYSVIVYFCFMN